ncbi:MAG: hypothetical protein M1823_002258 [Watsoniomyces obsoletus]|nr:MAG: hypothetical protein M1823_002258 [Watsoniomyces obsoletus]
MALQLFPTPPSGSTAAGGTTSKPKRKPSRRKAATPTPTSTPPPPPSSSSQAMERIKSPTDLEEIVIQVSEPSKAVSRSITPVRGATPSTERRGETTSHALTTGEDVKPGKVAAVPVPKENDRPTGDMSSKERPRALSPGVTERRDRQHLKETVATERSKTASPANTATSDAKPPKSMTSRPAMPASRATSPALTKEIPSRPVLPPRATSPALTKSGITSGDEKRMRSNSDATVGAPIRSIFPQYNPTVPLAHQNYRPTQASPKHIPREHISKEPYSPTLYSTGSPGQHTTSPGRVCLSASSTVSSFPAGVLGNHPPRHSSLEELVDLWEAANGQGTIETGKTFSLKVTRDGSINPHSRSFIPSPTEAFTLGPNREQPFYDFQILRGNEHDKTARECHIRRRHPRNGTVIPIMSLEIEPATRQQPKEDGFVTSIYPKLAAMMAMDRARVRIDSNVATGSDVGDGMSTLTDGLSTEELEEVTQDAVRRAARFEQCQLYWDHDSSRYYLLHPGLNRPHGQRFVIDIEGACGFDIPGSRGSIRISTLVSSSITSGGVGGGISSSNTSSAGVASSTIGSTTMNGGSVLETLGAIEFSTNGNNNNNNTNNTSLLIDTSATARIKCLYMVDIVISALITVGIVEGRKSRYPSMSTIHSFSGGGGMNGGMVLSTPPVTISGVGMITTARTMSPPPSSPQQQQQQQQPAQSMLAASASASAMAAAAAVAAGRPNYSIPRAPLDGQGQDIQRGRTTTGPPQSTMARGGGGGREGEEIMMQNLPNQYQPPPISPTRTPTGTGIQRMDEEIPAKKTQSPITGLIKSVFWIISLLIDALTRSCGRRRGGDGGDGGDGGGGNAGAKKSSPASSSTTGSTESTSTPPLANQV